MNSGSYLDNLFLSNYYTNVHDNEQNFDQFVTFDHHRGLSGPASRALGANTAQAIDCNFSPNQIGNTILPTQYANNHNFTPPMFETRSERLAQVALPMDITNQVPNNSLVNQTTNIPRKRKKRSNRNEMDDGDEHIAGQNMMYLSPMTSELTVDIFFESFDDLLASLQNMTRNSGFKVGRSTHAMKFGDAKRLFNIPHQTAAEYERDRHCCLPTRGWFYCIKGGKSCPFRVHFAFDADARNYRIIDTCEKHDHALGLVEPCENMVKITHELDLQREERELITHIGPFLEVDVLLKQLNLQFPDRRYDFSLIQMLKARGNQIHRGQRDPESLNQLLALGKKIESEGGVFSLNIDCYFRLAEVHIQTAAMKQYTAKYGDFTNVESIDQLPIKGYKYVIFKNVDCFNREVLTGISIIHWEHFTDLSKPLHLFGLGQTPLATLITDDEPVFDDAAKLNYFKHLFSQKTIRKTQKALASCGSNGLPTDWIHGTVNQILGSSNLSTNQCDDLLQKLAATLNQNEEAIGSIDFLLKNKKTLCAAYTANIFHPMASDELNFPRRKSSTDQFQLFEMLENQLYLFEKRELQTRSLICCILDGEDRIAPHVNELFKSMSTDETIRYTFNQLPDVTIAGAKFKCWNVVLTMESNSNDNLIHKVCVPYSLHGEHDPICDCSQFCSSKLPCQAMMALLDFIDCLKEDNVVDVNDFVCPRWDMRQHPLFQVAYDLKYSGQDSESK